MSTNSHSATGTTVSQLHQAAMESYDVAVAADKAGDPTSALEAYRQALEYESEAAARLAARIDFEPTRSVIHRSAAAIALRCGEYRQAERLIAVALTGDPHQEIADELRELLDQVNFERHMKLRGIRLASNEVQLSIAGDAVGDGIAESDEFVGRVQVAEKLLIRTIERRTGRPFRETGKAIKEIADNYQLYLSAARASSFAVTLRVGLPEDQLFLGGMEDMAPKSAGEVVRDVLDCLEAYNAGQDARLRELIPEEDYHRNFVALARQLAPDGKRVKLVGLTAEGKDAPRRVALDRPRKIAILDESKPPEGEVIDVIGRLLFANSTTKRNMIRVVDDGGEHHRFSVPTGVMADIVKPLYEDRVRAVGVRKGKRRVELRTIDLVREPKGLSTAKGE